MQREVLAASRRGVPSWCTSRSGTRSRRSPWTPRTTATRCPGSWSRSCTPHLERAEADPAVRVVLVQAAGTVFCSGADLSEATADGMEEGARRIVALQRLIVAMSKPVVAACTAPSGPAASASSPRATSSIAADDATFALTEVKLGLAAAIISLTVLPRMTPARRRADHAGRRGRSRRRGGGVRPGDPAVPARRAGRRGRPASARRSPPAPPRACARPSGSSTATCWPASTRTATRWPRCAPGSSPPTRRARRWRAFLAEEAVDADGARCRLVNLPEPLRVRSADHPGVSVVGGEGTRR